MTPSELKDLLFKYDNGELKGTEVARRIHAFGIWWHDHHLTEEQKDVIRGNPFSCWGDLRQMEDDELILLWAVFKM
jgi:hypothetical protein